ncbi:unnamed protein product [Amoebophrya sp. A120]|nr:unnamed protein product [Amoebophrya sp. A120]|eukprot:GSA120T00004040001.1
MPAVVNNLVRAAAVGSSGILPSTLVTKISPIEPPLGNLLQASRDAEAPLVGPLSYGYDDKNLLKLETPYPSSSLRESSNFLSPRRDHGGVEVVVDHTTTSASRSNQLDVLEQNTSTVTELLQDIKGAEQKAVLLTEADPCCLDCTNNKSKYYSIDHLHVMCGETCMMDWQYPIFKLFEPGLTKAHAVDETICKEKGYSTYKETVTHGFGPIKSTLDLYAPDPAGSGGLLAASSSEMDDKAGTNSSVATSTATSASSARSSTSTDHKSEDERMKVEDGSSSTAVVDGALRLPVSEPERVGPAADLMA